MDGTVSEAGQIDGDRLLQAKSRYYSLTELLAARAWAKDFDGGSFATLEWISAGYTLAMAVTLQMLRRGRHRLRCGRS